MNIGRVSAVATVAAGVVLTGVLVPSAQAGPPSYGSNGVFNVSTNPRPGWATSSIEPGRYRVDQAPSMAPYQSAQGFWYRCHNYPCSPSYPANVIASAPADRNAPTFVDILPSDVAVALHNVTLTVAG